MSNQSTWNKRRFHQHVGTELAKLIDSTILAPLGEEQKILNQLPEQESKLKEQAEIKRRDLITTADATSYITRDSSVHFDPFLLT